MARLIHAAIAATMAAMLSLAACSNEPIDGVGDYHLLQTPSTIADEKIRVIATIKKEPDSSYSIDMGCADKPVKMPLIWQPGALPLPAAWEQARLSADGQTPMPSDFSTLIGWVVGTVVRDGNNSWTFRAEGYAPYRTPLMDGRACTRFFSWCI